MIQTVRLARGLVLERDLRLDEGGDPHVHAWELLDERGVSCSDHVHDGLYEWLSATAGDIDCFGGRQFWSGRMAELEEERVP